MRLGVITIFLMPFFHLEEILSAQNDVKVELVEVGKN